MDGLEATVNADAEAKVDTEALETEGSDTRSF